MAQSFQISGCKISPRSILLPQGATEKTLAKLSLGQGLHPLRYPSAEGKVLEVTEALFLFARPYTQPASEDDPQIPEEHHLRTIDLSYGAGIAV
ncbi:hypothetical protein V9T40_009890 [Parthenolecanium corni]|uniref:Uncharacterized protein n=1 Tax=Parthenolecanium corni TaxID=536013 RepID=A0AAN9Y633_9HEMI